jgi:hypothetical protein
MTMKRKHFAQTVLLAALGTSLTASAAGPVVEVYKHYNGK